MGKNLGVGCGPELDLPPFSSQRKSAQNPKVRPVPLFVPVDKRFATESTEERRAFTPTGFHIVAQGCEHRELPWVYRHCIFYAESVTQWRYTMSMGLCNAFSVKPRGGSATQGAPLRVDPGLRCQTPLGYRIAPPWGTELRANRKGE